jgi:hypothetical protein
LQKKSINREGIESINKYGSRMIVDIYNSPIDIWVLFPETGDRIHSTWQNFKLKVVRSVFDKTLFGIGFIGSGEYKVTINGEYTNQYLTWRAMLQRCYDEKFHKKQPTYVECSVTEEWLNFQNFAAWYDLNYYQIDGEIMSLDKDILIKGNKLYSPDTCVFVPQSINSIFIKGEGLRGDLPIGVHHRKDNNKYRVKCNDGKGNQTSVGQFTNITDAFKAYKSFKEKVIKQVAEEYKNRIPNRVYQAMITYRVEITD